MLLARRHAASGRVKHDAAMKLRILGTAGYHPSETRQTTCLLLPGSGVVFDAGTAFFRITPLLETPTLDIFLTHAHLDHCVGLTYLLNVMYQRKLERVTIHGDAEKLASIREHLFHRDIFPVLPSVEWRPLQGDVLLSDGGRLTYWPQQHPGGSLGYRVDWANGSSLAFVTDTTARDDADYVRHIQDVHLLVHECNFNDGFEALAESTGHSCTTPVARVAQASRVRQLVLTHFDPLADAVEPIDIAVARATFPNTQLAYDGLCLEF